MANISRYNDPFAGLTNLHSQLDDIFNNFFSPMVPNAHGIPAMDVYTEDDKQLVSELAAPGFTPNDIDINVSNGILEIKGDRHDKTEEGKQSKRNYMMRESHASFYRSIVLPKHADTDNIKADFTDGVLRVTVPFKELPKPKKIAISSGKNGE